MKNRYIGIITTLILFIPILVSAKQFDLGERITINSVELNEERELQILLPENYQENLKASYPVIYLLDGDYNFHGVSGILDMLANKGQLIPDVILVGLADKGTEKYRKYMTPDNFDTPVKLNNKGNAAAFLAFINSEVQPFIKKNYRVSEHSSLFGVSVGGLFVLNALLETPDSFNNYISISPSVWVSDNAIVKKAKEKLVNDEHQPISLYLALADEVNMGQYDFINQLDITPLKNTTWSFKHYPDENHNSVGLIAFRDSLKKIFDGWYVAEKKLEKQTPEETIRHYETLQAELGIQHAIPASVVHYIIRQHYRTDKGNKVSQFIANASKRLPASKQVLISKQASFAAYYDSPKKALELLKSVEHEFEHSITHVKDIAGIYEQLKDKKMATHYYQKALALAKKQNVNQWQMNIIQAKI